jgi:hypothetical protein
MRQTIIGFLVIMALSSSCKPKGTMVAIQPKSGTIELPAKGEFRIWKGLTHPSFSVTLSNPSATQSCEIYSVKNSGNEKWISPSLQAGKTLTVTVPSNGHLLFKNYNDNILNIAYEIEE